MGTAHTEASISLRFLGAAGTVTGSKTVVATERHTIMIDCGFFQGIKELRRKNWEQLPITANEIEAVLLTHSHLDHCGYLPKLVREGFKGPIHTTSPSREITQIILEDSAKIQEEDAEHANKHGYTKHQPAKPLYNSKDVKDTMPLFVPQPLHEWIKLNDEMQFRFSHSGHILGSVFIELDCLGKRLVFSGDLGRQEPLMLDPPETIQEADYLVMESTYGDRLHPSTDPEDDLAEAVNNTLAKGGHLIIPSFVLERAQELMVLLHRLKKKGQISQNVPVYLDSPMGVDITNLFVHYKDWHRLATEECEALNSGTTLIKSFDRTRSVLDDPRSKIIIAGSGMITGGRILYYLQHLLDDNKNTVLLVGYQAEGTRGRQLRSGMRELKFHGHYHEVRADVMEIGSLSAHADRGEILQWLNGFANPPQKVFLNHGEPQASDYLRVKIQDEYGWPCEIAKDDVAYPLE